MGDSDDVSLGTVDLGDLRMFLAIAQAGSLRAAAGQLFISQPTLSRAVARLEAEFGTRLLDRGPRGVRLTRDGEALRTAARRVLSAAADLRREVTGARSGTLQLGATATSARSFLAPFLAQWLPAHRDVAVTAIEGSEARLRASLERGDCDVAIVCGPLPPTLESLRLATVRVVAVFPPGHRLADSTEPVSVRDLAGEPLLVNGPPYRSDELLRRALDAAGLDANVVYECSVGQTLAAMAEAGLGIAVFGDTVDLRGFTLGARAVHTADGQPLTFDMYVAWAKDDKSSKAKDFARALCTENSVPQRPGNSVPQRPGNVGVRGARPPGNSRGPREGAVP